MRYIIFPHLILIERKIVVTYGLLAINGLKIRVFKDVTTDKKTFKKVVKDMNKNQIEFVHIINIFEDYIW